MGACCHNSVARTPCFWQSDATNNHPCIPAWSSLVASPFATLTPIGPHWGYSPSERVAKLLFHPKEKLTGGRSRVVLVVQEHQMGAGS